MHNGKTLSRNMLQIKLRVCPVFRMWFLHEYSTTSQSTVRVISQYRKYAPSICEVVWCKEVFGPCWRIPKIRSNDKPYHTPSSNIIIVNTRIKYAVMATVRQILSTCNLLSAFLFHVSHNEQGCGNDCALRLIRETSVSEYVPRKIYTRCVVRCILLLFSTLSYISMDSVQLNAYIFTLIITSSNWNIFCVTVPFCGVSTGRRWIPLTKWQ